MQEVNIYLLSWIWRQMSWTRRCFRKCLHIWNLLRNQVRGTFSDNRQQHPSRKFQMFWLRLSWGQLVSVDNPKVNQNVRLYLPGKRCVLAFSWTLISWEASVSECSPSSTHQYQMIHLASYQNVFRQHLGVKPDMVRGISNCCSKLQKEEEVAFPRVNVQHSRVLR